MAKRTANENQAKEQAAALARGAAEVISPAELAAKIALGRPLRIKLGMDPTAPDLHLGHSLTLKKLRDFQDAGHTVIFLIGDFTAMIGDPTGRSETRKPLSRDEIERNAQTYREQAFKILDRELTEVRFNSEWMNGVNVAELIKIAATLSVARLLERDDFEKRLAAQEPLFLHELLYPVIQAYDSVALKADLEIGGTDQKFNMLVGRDLQRHFGQDPQAVMTMPLLEGLDGLRKMSKSLGNYVGLTDQPEDMYGKLMSVPDKLMVRYYELLTVATPEELAAVKSGAMHPMEAKKRLARTLVTEYHGAPAATRAEEYFESKHQRREVPASAQVYRIAEDLWICELMKQLQFTPSTSEARRLVSQGAVRVDGRTITDVNFRFVPGEHKVLEVGKRRVARIEP
ncbi:MAG TPA: tyrosine--tRNA ligase [Candidatus Binatus sp.]|uniref:tyrosine--tRNA ligase n=1 Tax=Candidatus Binatus sp. TaxID=2811406 RepID=UPI002F3EEE35